MSQENVETVRAMFDQFARGDFSRWFADGTDDFEFVASPEVPDAGTYRGEAASRWLTVWVESFERRRLVAVGGDEVVIVGEISGRGKTTGAPFVGHGAALAKLTHGKVVRFEWFANQEDALEAAGLRE